REALRQRRIGRLRQRRAQPDRRDAPRRLGHRRRRPLMELRFVTLELRRLDEVASEVLACGVFADERPHHGAAGLVDWRLSGTVSRLVEQGFLTGKRGEVVMLPLRPKLPFDKALLFGLGARADFDDAAFREVTAHLLRAIEGLCARTAVV